MGDREVIALAAAAWLGAALAVPVPRSVGALLLLVVVALRRPLPVLGAVLILSAGLGAAARDGLAPVEAATFSGEVDLVRDPVRSRFGVRAEVRVGGSRLHAVASGGAAAALAPRHAGERITVVGAVQPLRAGERWLRVRHVVGRIEIERIEGWRPGAPPYRVANGLRGVLARGGDALPAGQRALYTGLLFGDDRGQPARMVDDFRAAGLGHLLAVSGQNVACVLAAARPLLERMTYRGRFPATLLVLGVFVLATRAEPSVLRAASMAGGAALAAALGREASSLRMLSLAVTGLVMVDPLLIESVGFQLSVAASAGILVLAPRLAVRLPGPRVLVEPAAVTLAAQIATAPLLIATFGGMPVAALPANLIAAPAAAPVMMWGFTGGAVAGAVGGPVATVLQLPARLLLGWIELVGSMAGRAPLGELSTAHAVALGAGAGCLLLARRLRRPGITAVAAVTVIVALAAPAVSIRSGSADGLPVAGGAWVWHRGGLAIVVLDGRSEASGVLAGLRRAGVRRVDLVVARSGGAGVGAVVAVLDERYGIGTVWAPAGHSVRGAVVPPAGSSFRVGRFTLTVRSVEPRPEVEISSPGAQPAVPGAPRAPPAV